MKVLVTPRSFGRNDNSVFKQLEDAGWQVTTNPVDRILTEDEMVDHIKGYDAVILGVDPMNAKILEAADKLKVISRYGVGLDNVDVNFAQSKGIAVYRTVGANANAVADYAFGLMLDVTRKISFIDRECRKGSWHKIKTNEMWGKTIGILGLGAIGKGIAKRASGFNMTILAYDPYVDEEFAKTYGVTYVDLDTLLKKADFISLHLPLTDETRNLISDREFDLMKDEAVIVNTARGAVINEKALYEALKNNKILGAGIDVFDQEPPQHRSFTELDNVVIGSHCAASSNEAIDNMSHIATENLLKHYNQILEGCSCK